MRNNSGFSLVELAVVIAIAGILSSIAIPAYLSWLPKYRLKNAAMDLRANLNSTKFEAIKNNTNWAVVFDMGTDSYHICSDNGANDTWDCPGGDDTVEKSIVFSDYNAGVKFTSVTGGPLVFTNRGMTNNVTVKITNKDASASYQIQTSLSGGIIMDRL